MSTALFLFLRVLHVLLAAIWVGATVFTSFLLMPAVQDTGPAGGQVMMSLNRKGITAFFGAMGGITVLTGIYLFWRFTGGFDPEISRSNAGMAFGIGGVAGILAVIIGGSVVGRSANKAAALMEQVVKAPDAQKGALMQQAGVLRQRMATFGIVVVLLQIIALVTMALAHYI
jgi:uncharacterized membrane protein